MEKIRDEEREAIEALLASEGWRLFAASVARDWGGEEGGGRRFLQGVRAAADNTTPTASEHLRQVVVAQREIHGLVSWPSRRLSELTREPAAVTGSRRGGL